MPLHMQFLVVLESQLCKDLLCFVGGRGWQLQDDRKVILTLLSLTKEIQWIGVIREGLGSIAHSITAPLLIIWLCIHICKMQILVLIIFLQYNPIPLGKKQVKTLKKYHYLSCIKSSVITWKIFIKSRNKFLAMVLNSKRIKTFVEKQKTRFLVWWSDAT